MSYKDEIDQIRARHGTLEQIRARVGMSRRQICEFLLVDPSAWTRWVREDKEAAPPHVYRTLGLLLERLAQDPGYIKTDIVEVKKVHGLEWQERVSEINQDVRAQFENLKTQVVAQAELTLGWKLLLLLNVVLVLYVLFR